MVHAPLTAAVGQPVMPKKRMVAVHPDRCYIYRDFAVKRNLLLPSGDTKTDPPDGLLRWRLLDRCFIGV